MARFRTLAPWRWAWLVPVLAALLLGCRGRGMSTDVARDTLEDVMRRGEIRAGYFVEPPAVMKDPNTGELRGSFVEAIKFIGSSLNVRVTFVEVDLAHFAGGLQTGLYDVSVGPTFRTIPRARNVAFTNTMFYLGYDGVVTKGRQGEFRTEADVDRSGVRVAVKEGSAIHQYVKDNFTNAELIVLAGTDLTLPLQAVSSGQADVGLMNEHTVEFYARAHPEVDLVLQATPIQVAGMSWATHPHDYRWLQFLNTSCEFLISTGKMAEWERKYYGRPLRRSLVEPGEPSISAPE